MTVALCLGGAHGAQGDWSQAMTLGRYDYVVACNDIGAIWPGQLDAWVTLHPEKMAGWRLSRQRNGFPEARRHLAHDDYLADGIELVEFRFPGQAASGSSGLFAAKVALCDLKADRAVLAGIPLDRGPHFFDQIDWPNASEFIPTWKSLQPSILSRLRSMSGWTANFLGVPTTEWMEGPAPPPEPKKEPVMNKEAKIAYEPHPVTPERKEYLRRRGYKIIDIIFKPETAREEREVVGAEIEEDEDAEEADTDETEETNLEDEGQEGEDSEDSDEIVNEVSADPSVKKAKGRRRR